jgi:hypothetical protein
MAAKSEILPPTSASTAAALEPALALLQVRGHITRNQSASILKILSGHLPAIVSLEQRTPKSIVYVLLDGALRFAIGVRASIRVNP